MKQTEASDKGNKHTNNLAPKSTLFLWRIRLQYLHWVLLSGLNHIKTQQRSNSTENNKGHAESKVLLANHITSILQKQMLP